MRLTFLPPLSTLALAGLLAGGAVLALPLAEPTETSAIAPAKPPQAGTQSAEAADLRAWAGPRAETRREVLMAPLFAEDRKLPDPFKIAPPPPSEPPVEMAAINPPSANPPQAVAPPAQAREPEPVAAAAPRDLPDLKLLGVLIRENYAKALLIEAKKGAEEVWVTRGDSIADWELTIVSPDAVRLEASGDVITLELRADE